jgi:hypothetical protein
MSLAQALTQKQTRNAWRVAALEALASGIRFYMLEA